MVMALSASGDQSESLRQSSRDTIADAISSGSAWLDVVHVYLVMKNENAGTSATLLRIMRCSTDTDLRKRLGA